MRTLRLGHQPAGYYQHRSKAAYWDGRNYLGEKVATGIYFYTLKAGDYVANPQVIDTKVVVGFQYDFFCEKIFQLSVKRGTYQAHFPLITQVATNLQIAFLYL